MLLCGFFVGLLWVLCGPLRSFVGPLRSFAVFTHTGSTIPANFVKISLVDIAIIGLARIVKNNKN